MSSLAAYDVILAPVITEKSSEASEANQVVFKVRLDATKPAGRWNQIRLLISPRKCEHWINGVKYFEYVLGSDDFNKRVANSKFRRMRLFAKSKTGYIALQGDHGQVSFRNIKIRPIKSDE